MAHPRNIDLYGRIFIRGSIRTITGLHIGGAQTEFKIGGVDNPIIRDPLTDKPYIPGSSLRGKMRSLWEKTTGVVQNQEIGKSVFIHVCKRQADYQQCPVCQIYGVPGESDASYPTRLLVRDVFLDKESADRLRQQGKTDMPYTEVKWEATIDRVTSAATPRQIERVPADTCFSGLEIVYSIYEEADINRFAYVIEAMQLLEDDYLGGAGSRGGGKISFEGLSLALRATRSADGYRQEVVWDQSERGTSVATLLEHQTALQSWIRDNIHFEAYRARREQA